jgi:hypothetical protein
MVTDVEAANVTNKDIRYGCLQKVEEFPGSVGAMARIKRSRSLEFWSPVPSSKNVDEYSRFGPSVAALQHHLITNSSDIEIGLWADHKFCRRGRRL